MVEIDERIEHSDIMVALEEIFKMGQNDFQPQPMPSLSVGDVVEWEPGRYKKYWLIMGIGWKNLNEEEFEAYKKIPLQDRAISTYKTGR